MLKLNPPSAETLGIEAIVEGRHGDPFALLGPHRGPDANHVIVRTFQPGAVGVDVRLMGSSRGWIGMSCRDRRGFFEASLTLSDAMIAGDADTDVDDHPSTDQAVDYRFRVTYPDGHAVEVDDPYRYGRILTDFDLHLFGEGTHQRLYQKLGAHPMTLGAIRGVHFAVWAPNAQRVSVVGDFNRWNGGAHPMRALTPSGIWELFVPERLDGHAYKFEIRTEDGWMVQKADPFGTCFEVPPRTASIVWEQGRGTWHDAQWMEQRAARNHWLDRPMSIYEVHLASWQRVPEDSDRSLTYRELAERLVPYVKEMGYTHVELLPVMEHPFSGSWGYQVVGYFAPTSRFGTPEDFKALVDAFHQAEIGVILDWVPGHFPKDDHGLARFDGSALYEHADWRQGEHKEWGTLVFNYGRHEVRNFLLSNALFWLNEYHIDGLRVDAVASILYLDYSRNEGEWVPNAFGGRENLDAIRFLQELNRLVHGAQTGAITAAEESTAWPGVSRPVHLGGLGFTYKWNMGWMHDTLQYAAQDPVYRPWAHNTLTFSMLYAFTENFILPFSHDEVVHGKRAMLDKMPGDIWQRSATLRATYGYMYGHPGKKLMFMGSEFGQWREWNHDQSLDWHLLAYPMHQGIKALVRDLNLLHQREPSLHQVDFEPAGFQWIDCQDHANSVVSFLRRARDPHDFTLVVMNFTPVPRHDYRVGVPREGFYREMINTDASEYAGSGVGNAGGVQAEPVPAHGHAWSVRLVLPPLSCLFLRPA